MLVIGLTGGIGSGKTKVANLFAELGVTIIDTDQISRDVVEPHQPAWTQIVEHFGNEILEKNNTLNRRLLREKIFENDAEREWLENLLHPLIRATMKIQVEKAASPYCIAVIPLLAETKPNPLINRVLVIDADETTQIERAKIRDCASTEHIKSIMASQASRAERLKIAHDVIENNGSIDDLKKKVLHMHKYYLDMAAKNTV